MTETHCKFCNGLVVWATTSNGKKVPLEPGAGWAGTYRLTQGADGTAFAERIPVHSPASQGRHRDHRAVCKPKMAKR